MEAGVWGPKKPMLIASAGKLMARQYERHGANWLPWKRQNSYRRMLLQAFQIAQFGVRFTRSSPYFPDLTPLDFHLFPILKKIVSRKHLESIQEPEIHSILDFREGILLFEKNWTKCTNSYFFINYITHCPHRPRSKLNVLFWHNSNW